MSKQEINTSGETIVPVDTIDRGSIFEEYIKARNSPDSKHNKGKH